MVACGRTTSDSCEGEDVCAPSSEAHEVRCCSDTELAGYQQRNDCEVWAESQFFSVGNQGFSEDEGCVSDADLFTAQQTCLADGARLCTLAEMVADCTAGTGCQHDHDMIWTSDECTYVPPDVVIPTAPAEATVSCGNPANGNCLEDYCAPNTELHEVRCCSDAELPGYQQRNDCEVWAESQFLSVGAPGGGANGPGCVHEADLQTQYDTCAMDGARVCTLSEMQGACTAGTGCGHDADMVWTTDECTGPPGMVVSCGNAINAACEDDFCADLAETHEMRCCSATELPGYQQRNGCAVWAESQFLSVGEAGQGEDGWNDAPGCVHDADAATAQSVCEGDGARLCTLPEVQARCTQGTGCGHDGDLVWTSMECEQ
jgi:hypothetical protein